MRNKQRERNIEIQRQRKRGTDRSRHTKTHKEIETETERYRQIETYRETDRERQRSNLKTSVLPPACEHLQLRRLELHLSNEVRKQDAVQRSQVTPSLFVLRLKRHFSISSRLVITPGNKDFQTFSK